MYFKIPIIFIAIIILSFYSCSYTKKSAETIYNKALLSAPYDAIIVPGYPYTNGKWNRIMKGRVLWAVHLYSKGITKNIIFSGSAVYSPYVEAEIMQKYAVALGVPIEHTFTETRAEHSTENVYYSYLIAKKNGFNNIALASDVGQTKMLKSFAHRFKIKTDFLPMVVSIVDTIVVNDLIINDSSAYVKGFVSITERENLFQRLRGTMGKNIKHKGKE